MDNAPMNDNFGGSSIDARHGTCPIRGRHISRRVPGLRSARQLPELAVITGSSVTRI